MGKFCVCTLKRHLAFGYNMWGFLLNLLGIFNFFYKFSITNAKYLFNSLNYPSSRSVLVITVNIFNTDEFIQLIFFISSIGP